MFAFSFFRLEEYTLRKVIIGQRVMQSFFLGNDLKNLDETLYFQSLTVANIDTRYIGDIPLCFGSGELSDEANDSRYDKDFIFEKVKATTDTDLLI